MSSRPRSKLPERRIRPPKVEHRRSPPAPSPPARRQRLSRSDRRPQDHRGGARRRRRASPIDTPSLGGSINLKGGKLDDLVLKDYRETIAKDSPLIRLFSPAGPPDAYWAETGFVGVGEGVKAPTYDTVWTADQKTLTPGQPVTLTWNNGQGLTFKRTFAVDDKYMFTITELVVNAGGETVNVRPYALVLRRGMPKVSGYSVLHEGFVGVFGDGGVQEVTYAKVDKETGRAFAYKGDGGWLGFTDKYWGSAIIPQQTTPIEARFTATGGEQPIDYQADFLGTAEDARARTRRPKRPPISSPAPRKSTRSTIIRRRSASRNST